MGKSERQRNEMDFFKKYQDYVQKLYESPFIHEKKDFISESCIVGNQSTAIDSQINSSQLKSLLQKARKASEFVGKSQISISESEAQLMSFFIKLFQCQTFIEIGTLTGYSSLWILSALNQGGTLWTLEKDPSHSKIAGDILNEWSGTTRGIVLTGEAEKSLFELSNKGPFDGIFIDGNKSAYLKYLSWAEKNVKKGGLIIADNIFLRGAVWGDETSVFSANQISVLKEFNQRLSNPEKYLSVFLPTSEGLSVSKKLF